MKRVSRLSVLLVIAVGLFSEGPQASAQTNPVHIIDVGSLSGGPAGISISGNFAYLANGAGLQVYDISNPNQPTDTGFRDTVQVASWVDVKGNYAYVPGYSQVRIFDILNRTNPVVVGSIDYYCSTVTASGELAYLCPSVGPGFQVGIFSISNPAAPTSVGTFDDEPTRIAVYGNYAFLVDMSLKALNVESASNPVQVGASYCFAVDVTVADHYAYVACFTNGFSIFDISNPTNLALVYHSDGDYESVAVSGNYAYLAGNTIAVYDVSNPTNAVFTGSINLAQPLFIKPQGFVVSKGYAYLAYGAGMSVFSVGQTVPPKLTIITTDRQVTCSWPTPNPAFAVQQNPDLDPAHWTTLTNASIVVGSQNQLTLPSPEGTMFYRLVSQ